MLLLELLVLRDEGVHPVYHALDQLHLGVAQAVLVGDVIGYACNKSSYCTVIVMNSDECFGKMCKS